MRWTAIEVHVIIRPIVDACGEENTSDYTGVMRRYDGAILIRANARIVQHVVVLDVRHPMRRVKLNECYEPPVWRNRGLEVNPNVLQRWRREFRQAPGKAFPGNGQRRWSEGRVAELERKIGQQVVEIDFLKGCLQRIEEQRMLQVSSGSPRSTGRSAKK